MNSVLVLHKISDRAWLDTLVTWLEQRYRLVTLSAVAEYFAGTAPLEDACHITVDDGDRSFYDVIFPVLKKHAAPASLFVSPQICRDRTNFWFQEIRGYRQDLLQGMAAEALRIDTRALDGFSAETIFKAMPAADMYGVVRTYQRATRTTRKAGENVSLDELCEMAGTGLVEIGAHTMTHPILTNETTSDCEYEIHASVSELSGILGRRVEHFAYPNGIAGVDFDEREQAILRSCGIRMAFTTHAGHFNHSDNPFRIPRIPISDKESICRVQVKLLLGSGWDSLRAMARTGERFERRRLNRAIVRQSPPAGGNYSRATC